MFRLVFIPVIFVLLFGGQFFAQDPQKLVARANAVSGIEKMQLLNQAAATYLNSSAGASLGHSAQVLQIAEEMKSKNPGEDTLTQIYICEVDANNNSGLALEKLGDPRKAVRYYRQARRMAEWVDYKEAAELAEDRLAANGKDEGFEVKASRWIKNQASKVDGWVKEDSTSNKVKNTIEEVVVGTNESLGKNAEKNGDPEKAIELYKKNLKYYESAGDTAQLRISYRNIARLYDSMGNKEEAGKYFALAAQKFPPMSRNTAPKGKEDMVRVYKDFRDIFAESSPTGEVSPEELRTIEEKENALGKAEQLARDGKFEESFDYFKKYADLQEKLLRMEKERELEAQELNFVLEDQLGQIQLLRQEQEIQEYNIREAELRTQRNRILALGFLVAAALLSILFFNKRKAHSQLTHTYNDLENTHRQLQNTQTQLVAAEKMASLGQLTAGVAHEINNPVNFISGNIEPLKNDVNDLLKILAAYESAVKDSNLESRFAHVEKLRQELDIDYVTTEIQDLVAGIDEGANRTAEIVRGLRTFARLDEQDRKTFSLEENINSTVSLLHHKMDNIRIVKNFDFLPEIDGFPGKINQVLMNVLDNAIQAMPNGGTITLTTLKKGQNVEIRIKDTGTGIPKEIQNRIFEPFFTTKDVGEGTGLGLSISHGIIQQHNGSINVESQEGKGTEVIISLPTGNLVSREQFA
ncbi:MAG: ATP-binding protein [Bacteroidia bacterium]